MLFILTFIVCSFNAFIIFIAFLIMTIGWSVRTKGLKDEIEDIENTYDLYVYGLYFDPIKELPEGETPTDTATDDSKDSADETTDVVTEGKSIT